MAIYRHISNLPASARGAVVAIGNFDGVHRGHQQVIGEIAHRAAALKTSTAVLTFRPHPRRFFQPEAPPFQLTPFRLKARLIEALGVDNLFLLTFNLALSQIDAEDFVRQFLVRDLAVAHVVVGDNFHFGHKRRGDGNLLATMGRELGFGVSVLERITGPNREVFSSTAIRNYLTAGNPTRAALLLGRYWEIEGRVQIGAKLGRTLGFPTANIALSDILEPARGVYAVRAGIDRGESIEWKAGVASLGVRPTVDGSGVLLEVHLFDFDGDLYGRHMRVALVDYLRPEWHFESLEAMRTQMLEDARRARVILAGERWEASWPASSFQPAAADGEGGEAE